jgi:hypothetical protein
MPGIPSPEIPLTNESTFDNSSAALATLAAQADTAIAAVAAAYAALQLTLNALSPIRLALVQAGRSDLAHLFERQARDINTGYVPLTDYPMGSLELGRVINNDPSKPRNTTGIFPANVTLAASIFPGGALPAGSH